MNKETYDSYFNEYSEKIPKAGYRKLRYILAKEFHKKSNVLDIFNKLFKYTLNNNCLPQDFKNKIKFFNGTISECIFEDRRIDLIYTIEAKDAFLDALLTSDILDLCEEYHQIKLKALRKEDSKVE